jgi:insertion element IS1 protein InsB
MVLVPVKCPYCRSDKVKKNGTAKNGKRRFLCCNENCSHMTFVEYYTYKAWDPNIRSRIFFSIVNGSGTRVTVGTLGIAKDTVTDAPRNIEALLWYVNYDYLNNRRKGDIGVDPVTAKEVGMEEMWSFVGDKSHQYWLWWAISHDSGEPLAFHFGTREHETPDELLALPDPFDIKVINCDNNYAYQGRVKKSEVKTGKEKRQKIERKHLSLRTWCSRLVRKGIRFSVVI